MAYTTIDDPTIYFNTLLYTGNTTQRSVTGVGFQPDWVWFKNRSASQPHCLVDAVRGVNNSLASNNNSLVDTDANDLQAFQSDGFQIGTNNRVNGNGNSMVAWNWKANGQGSSNTDGSINTTYTSVNTTAGFSISKYTGTGSNATVGHGLGAVPKMIIAKEATGSVNDWTVYHATQGNTTRGILNETNAWGSNTAWNNTTPTSSVFSIGSGSNTNRSGSTYIAYCFAEITGYSKFEKYSGNQSNDGTYIYLGFKPAFFLAKQTTNKNWYMKDNKRLASFNPANGHIYPNQSNAEEDYADFDFLSNGVKIRHNGTDVNESGGTYIYMAFAESPFVNSSGAPTNAR